MAASTRLRRSQRKKQLAAADPVESAALAKLQYVSETGPGIIRKRAGAGFRYLDSDGKPIRDKKELARIAALVIPPAWTSVWICPNPNGHIQAAGRDAKGRKPIPLSRSLPPDPGPRQISSTNRVFPRSCRRSRAASKLI